LAPEPPAWAGAAWDLIVVGGGNAAVSAAMAADDRGAVNPGS
jgi:succinate dehydrogenase/fumarate reductase flavoprotein subunit